jgi:hypothetical protein
MSLGSVQFLTRRHQIIRAPQRSGRHKGSINRPPPRHQHPTTAPLRPSRRSRPRPRPAGEEGTREHEAKPQRGRLKARCVPGAIMGTATTDRPLRPAQHRIVQTMELREAKATAVPQRMALRRRSQGRRRWGTLRHESHQDHSTRLVHPRQHLPNGRRGLLRGKEEENTFARWSG